MERTSVYEMPELPEIKEPPYIEAMRDDYLKQAADHNESIACKSLVYNIWHKQIVTCDGCIKLGDTSIFHLLGNIWTILKASHIKKRSKRNDRYRVFL